MTLEEKIQEIITIKTNWDLGTKEYPNLTNDLLQEYITSINKISNLHEDYLLNKLFEQLDIIRYKDFKEKDNFIKYNYCPVTSKEFKEIYRNNNGLKSININYQKNGNAICLFEKTKNLSGIDFNNLNEIKKNFYYQLTNILGRCNIYNNNLIIRQNETNIVTANIDQNKCYIDYIKSLIDSKITTYGITTIEFNEEEKIIHDQINNGVSYLITNQILNQNNMTMEYTSDNIENITMAKILLNYYGENAILDYFSNSSKLINLFLKTKIGKKNILFYADDYKKFANILKNRIKNILEEKNLNELSKKYIDYQLNKIKENELLKGQPKELQLLLKEIISYKKTLEIKLKIESKIKKLKINKLKIYELINNRNQNPGIIPDKKIQKKIVKKLNYK